MDILKKSNSKNLRKELLKPTKIYAKEILKLNSKKLINLQPIYERWFN